MKTSRRDMVAAAGGGLAALAALGVTENTNAQGQATVEINADLLATLRDCVDKMAIKELFGRYAHAIDTGDSEGWAAVFTEDGQYELFGNTTKGRPAIAAAITGRREGRPHSQHRMANHHRHDMGDGVHQGKARIRDHPFEGCGAFLVFDAESAVFAHVAHGCDRATYHRRR